MNILFVTPRLPYPPNKGDKSIIYSRIKYLSKNHTVDLVSLILNTDNIEYIKELKKYCEVVKVVYHKKLIGLYNIFKASFYTYMPFQVAYFVNNELKNIVKKQMNYKRYDMIWVSTIRGIELIRNISDVPIILEMIDSIASNYESRIHLLSFHKKLFFLEEIRSLKIYENRVCNVVNEIIIVSDTEMKYIKCKDKIHIIPIGVEASTVKRDEQRKKFDLIFTGNLSYYANNDAIIYFINKIFPKLYLKGISLSIVGSNPQKSLLKIIKRNKNIKLYKNVRDINEYLSQAKISIVPLRTGSGQKFKILEAMSNNIPVITTSKGAEGLKGLINRYNILISNSDKEFITFIEELLHNKKLYNRIVERANKLVKNNYSSRLVNSMIENIINRYM